jgi:hypothetical protein
MKIKTLPCCRLAAAGFGIIAMMGSVLLTHAQDLIVNSFDNDGGGTFGLDWSNFRSYASGVTETFDPTQDSEGNTSSGSMYLTVQWPIHSNSTWNESWNDIQFAFYTPPFNPTAYLNFEVDIKVDVTNSSPAIDGTSYGAIELIVNNPWTSVVGWATLAVTNDWQHFSGSLAVLPDETNSEAVIGFISNGGDSLTNTVSYWIDNLVFTAPPSVNTNRPALNLTKVQSPGLTCIASKPAGTYQRQMLSTVNDHYSWNTATASANTSTYSMTFASFPGTNYPGFDAEMFLVPQAGQVATPFDDNIDWDSTNVAALMIAENPDQTATATFQYKINAPTSWNTALMVQKPCASGPLGKWTVTFQNNTNVTLTAPDQTSTNFTIPASAAAYFQDPLYLYVGTQPNNNANIGQSATLSSVQVSGPVDQISDNFATLNTNTWTSYAADPNGVIITGPDAKYWISWPFPDTGFTNIFVTDNLANSIAAAQWLALPPAATGWISVGGNKRLTLIDQSVLDAAFGYTPKNCFFQLFHP